MRSLPSLYRVCQRDGATITLHSHIILVTYVSALSATHDGSKSVFYTKFVKSFKMRYLKQYVGV